ncbi:Uncharacterized protein MLTONO_p0163 (plasmid) [Mesorhizobium loti]|nr:Uncharacterized protein MLTONO_p0163 [Mesorhizobium loti]
MTRSPIIGLVLACAVALMPTAPAKAADAAFAYKTSYRNIAKDPDGVWAGPALAPSPAGTVIIHEYTLKSAQGDWLISQIWNADCDSTACPTRLVRTSADGKKTVVIDDMMHQVIPPDDPRFAALPKSGVQAAFAKAPFHLSADGKELWNGDLRFEIGGSKP